MTEKVGKLGRGAVESWRFITRQRKFARKLKQQIKIEKETYLWDFCKMLFQLNCLFAEINVQRLSIKEDFQS